MWQVYAHARVLPCDFTHNDLFNDGPVPSVPIWKRELITADIEFDHRWEALMWISLYAGCFDGDLEFSIERSSVVLFAPTRRKND